MKNKILIPMIAMLALLTAFLMVGLGYPVVIFWNTYHQPTPANVNVTMTPDIAEGALTMGPDPMFRVDKGGSVLDISGIKIYQKQSGVLVPVKATCNDQTVDVAVVNNSCTTITPGEIAGCEWVTVSYPGARPTRFKIFNWANGATGPCS